MPSKGDRNVPTGFPREEVDRLLVKCHRRCCICHRYCGTKIETDHIDLRALSKDDSIENAIPVCFECHAEIHSYNDKHPRGRKFRPEELRLHRDQWLKICADKPEAMLSAAWDGDVGPLQALMDELDFNKMVAQCSSTPEERRGALFENAQFLRAIQEGIVAILQEELKKSILAAYVSMSRANQHILAEVNHDERTRQWGAPAMNARAAITEAGPLIEAAYKELGRYLASEGPS
jgi:hypothetical protein